jgi:hypothetical protein
MMNLKQVENAIKEDSQQQDEERTTSATIPHEEVQEILNSNDQEKGGKIIFKRNFKNRPINNDLDNKIIEDFENLIKNKPNGTWLIRESRQIGLFSITYKNWGEVWHTRYAFIDGKYREVADKELKKIANKFINMSITNIANGCEALLRTIFATNPILTLDHLLLPSKTQVTEVSQYQRYVVVQKKVKIYNDPVKALRKIGRQIDVLLKKSDAEIAMMDLSFLKVYPGSPTTEVEHREQLKERFCAWLTSAHLETAVFSPISLEIFKAPYVLQESGRVFDYHEIYHDGKLLISCPITRIPIKKTPCPIKDWNEQLDKCLQKFQLLINKCLALGTAATTTTTTTTSSTTTGGFFSSSLPAANQALPPLSQGAAMSSSSEEETSHPPKKKPRLTLG